MSQLLVNSGYPALPFFVVDHGIDSNRTITVTSGAAVLNAGQILYKVAATLKYAAFVSGSGNAKGILFHRTDPTAGDRVAAMFVHGIVRSGSLTGFEATSQAQLEDQIQFV